MKLLLLSGVLAIGLMISVLFNLFAGEENRTTILIHGHESEILYEVSVLTIDVDYFIIEQGEFSCSNMMCHIEHH